MHRCRSERQTITALWTISVLSQRQCPEMNSMLRVVRGQLGSLTDVCATVFTTHRCVAIVPAFVAWTTRMYVVRREPRVIRRDSIIRMNVGRCGTIIIRCQSDITIDWVLIIVDVSWQQAVATQRSLPTNARHTWVSSSLTKTKVSNLRLRPNSNLSS